MKAPTGFVRCCCARDCACNLRNWSSWRWECLIELMLLIRSALDSILGALEKTFDMGLAYSRDHKVPLLAIVADAV